MSLFVIFLCLTLLPFIFAILLLFLSVLIIIALVILFVITLIIVFVRIFTIKVALDSLREVTDLEVNCTYILFRVDV